VRTRKSRLLTACSCVFLTICLGSTVVMWIASQWIVIGLAVPASEDFTVSARIGKGIVTLSETKTSEVRLDGVQFFSYDLGERLSEYRRRSGMDIDPYKKWFAFNRVSVKRPDGKYFMSRILSFPIGLATLAFAFPLACMWWIRVGRPCRRRRRGLCVRCGYDLRANLSGKCPECGLEYVADHLKSGR
jgi:hypothetical protein